MICCIPAKNLGGQMTILSLSEKGHAFRDIILTTKIVQVFQDYEKNRCLTTRQKEILSRGANIISKIIEGSTLVEGKDRKSVV